MSSIKTRATVGPDGVIHLDLPVGAEHAGTEFEVTAEPTGNGAPKRTPKGVQYPPGYRRMSREEWAGFIEKTAGSIGDPGFVRPPQPPLVDRGPIFG